MDLAVPSLLLMPLVFLLIPLWFLPRTFFRSIFSFTSAMSVFFCSACRTVASLPSFLPVKSRSSSSACFSSNSSFTSSNSDSRVDSFPCSSSGSLSCLFLSSLISSFRSPFFCRSSRFSHLTCLYQRGASVRLLSHSRRCRSSVDSG